VPRPSSNTDHAVLTTGARRDLLVSIASSSVAGALGALQCVLFASAIASVLTGGQTLPAIRLVLVGLVTTIGARAAAVWTGDVLAQRAAGAVKTHVRDDVVCRLLRGGPQPLRGERTGEITNTLVGGVDTLDGYVGQFLPHAALAIVVPLMVLAVVFALDPISAVVLGVTGPLIPVFMWLIGGAARSRTREQWVTLSRLSARFLDAVQALSTLKAFGRIDNEVGIIDRSSNRFETITLSVLRVAFLSSLVLELLATLGVAIVAVEVSLRLLYARMAFREACTVLLLAPEFYRPLRTLGASFHAGMAGREVLQRIAELRRQHPLMAARGRRLAPGPGGRCRSSAPSVLVDRVTFAYRAEGRPAVDEVTINLAAGSTVALVGPSGSGKSTVASLLLGFIEPAAGLVLVDGHRLASVPISEWRRRVAWVPQRPHLFYGSVVDNLRLARPDASLEEIDRALSNAHASEFVAALPDGLATHLGERGARLSGGQAQRLALARAFLKDAPFLVLDEPTAHIDPEAEASIRDAMTRLRVGRTVLIIAHRLATVAAADTVVVMDCGRVVASGTHDTLVRDGGRYVAMVKALGGTV